MKTFIVLGAFATIALICAANGAPISVPLAVGVGIGCSIASVRTGKTQAVAFCVLLLCVAAIAHSWSFEGIASAAIIAVLCSAVTLFFVPASQSGKRFRVLLITRHIAPDVGGTETFITDFLKFTSANEIEVDVVTLKPLGGRIAPPAHTRLHYISWRPLVRLLWEHRETPSPVVGALLFCAASISLAVRALLIAPAVRPSVLYAVGGPIAAASGVLVKALTGIPLVLHFHRMYQWSMKARPVRWVVRAVYGYSDCVIGNSVMIEMDAARLGVPIEKVVGISNWVDGSIFFPQLDRSALRSKWGVPDERVVLLFTGLFDPIKHADRIISALQHVDDPRVVFLFAGHGPLEAEIRSLNRPGCDVRMLGMCDHRQLAELANLSDVHFWGSVDVKYPGLVVMEAMMCGAPEITTSITMNDRWDGDASVDATSFGAPHFAWTFAPNDAGILEAVRFSADNVEHLRSIRAQVARYAQDLFGIKNAERLLVRLRTAAADE